MHPVYSWGGLYPYHANPTHQHYAANDDPRAKEISSHMKMDPNPTTSIITSPYQPWPYNAGNYFYPGPQECYNHGCFGGPYGFQPPYPYYPPPASPYHSHGFHPPFPGAYSYSIPPPHYSVEQPRYDYDKNAHASRHCCGCDHREDEKKSMVKQEEPEIEKKTSGSLIPYLMKDYPYPIMWVPPGFVNTESNPKEKEKHTHDRVPLNESKEMEKEKHTHDRIPLDEALEPLKEGGNSEMERKQPGGDDNRLPFPIFWFPFNNNEVGEKNVKESPSARSDDKKRQTKINDEAEYDTGIKPLVQKVIPVKQLGTEEEKNRPKSIETKAKSASVEKTDNGNEGKASSPKTPKLPPVCLRVDPLPRKKNTTSRSPSPPGDKIRSKGSTINESRSSQQQQQQQTQLSDSLKKSNEEQNVKTIKVVQSDCEKKKLSENEAALIVQSVYRGFQVRKSKPIMKLRQIAEVGKRVVELRNRVRDLESSSFDNKEKLVIGETIMSLLLKLDTIQGLHPMVREVRKCVAKELVGLQEKLDSLKPETSINEEDTTKRVKEDNDKSETQPNSNANLVQESPKTNLEPEAELQLLDDDDDVIQDKLGGKDDDIHEKSETQSDSNVESGMINSEDGTNVDEDQLLLDDVELPQADGNGESGGKDDDEMEQKVAEDNSKGQMSADVIQAESGTNVEPQSTEGVTKNQMEETDTAAECEEFNAEEASEMMNVKPPSTEEMLSNEENVEDSVKAMEGVVKEQMDVIRELTAKVKDLEKKLLKKNKNNNKKMKKANKGRKSRVCVVEQE